MVSFRNNVRTMEGSSIVGIWIVVTAATGWLVYRLLVLDDINYLR